MKSTLVFCIICTMSTGLTLAEPTQATAGSGPSEAPQIAAPDDLSLPVYTPPRKLSPRARVGGEMRGTNGSDPEVQALVPDHVGLTINQTPALNWFLSKPTAYSVRFTLIDNRSIKPVYEADIPSPKKAGIQTISLKEMGLTLEPDVQYRWYRVRTWESCVRNSSLKLPCLQSHRASRF